MILATCADDTAFLANASCPIEASRITQELLDSYGKWTNRRYISTNGRKSPHCNFTLWGKILPRVQLLNITIPQSPQAQYLGLILDKRLTWKQHTTKIAATFRAKLRKLNWLLKPTSKLSLGNKVLLFQAIVVPSMTYCMQLWGMASDSKPKGPKPCVAYDCRRAVVHQEWPPSNWPSCSLSQGADKPALQSVQ